MRTALYEQKHTALLIVDPYSDLMSEAHPSSSLAATKKPAKYWPANCASSAWKPNSCLCHPLLEDLQLPSRVTKPRERMEPAF
jgi:hypothetical protein